MMNSERFGRNFRGLIEILHHHLPEETEENYESRWSAQPVSRPRFEPNSSRIQDCSIAATSACLECLCTFMDFNAAVM